MEGCKIVSEKKVGEEDFLESESKCKEDNDGLKRKKMLIEILDQPALQVNNFISTSYGLAIPHLSNIHAFAFLSFFFENPRTPPSYVPSSLLYKLWMSQRIKLGVFHCSTLFHCSTVPLLCHLQAMDGPGLNDH